MLDVGWTWSAPRTAPGLHGWGTNLQQLQSTVTQPPPENEHRHKYGLTGCVTVQDGDVCAGHALLNGACPAHAPPSWTVTQPVNANVSKTISRSRTFQTLVQTQAECYARVCSHDYQQKIFQKSLFYLGFQSQVNRPLVCRFFRTARNSETTPTLLTTNKS